MKPPLPVNESERLAALREYNILDSGAEKVYDDLTYLAMQICETPIALITLVDANRQWFKSKIGIELNETPRDVSFCAHTILEKDLMVTNDATLDERFCDNPFVVSEPKLRFYAGAPLISPDGYSLGTICVVDFKPRQLTPEQQESLRALARQTVALLELRKHAEREIAEGRKLIQSLVDSAFDGYCIHEEGTIVEANEKVAALFGYTAKELIGKNVLTMIAPEYREVASTRIQTRDESPYQEVIGLRKDGTLFPIEVFVKNDPREGRFRRVVVCRDITSRKHAEELIRESEKRFRALIENSADGIALMRSDGSFEYVSPSNERIAGYTTEDLFRTHFYDFIHPDDLEALMDVWKRTLESRNESIFAQCRYKHKDGTWHWLEFVNKNLLHEPSIQAIVSNYRDITARKKAEEALRDSEEKYRALFEESRDVVFISEASGRRFIDINQAGVELFGYESKEELLQVNIANDLFVNAADRVVLESLMKEHGYVKDFQQQLKKKNGDRVIILETSTAVRNENGEIVIYRGIMRDVTKVKQLQEQLMQAQKMETVGQLAGGVAHDFNNILMAIMGYCELIKMKLPSNEDSLQHVDETIRAAERGASLTKQLLAFSRKQVLKPRSISLNETLLGMRNLLKRLIGEDVDLDMHLEPELGAVKVDPSQIEQVIMNLAVNARHAMPEGGKLTISTSSVELDENFVRTHFGSRGGPFVRLQITDSGHGMDKQTMSHMFEPFFTTKEKGKGTGLGLSTVYGIIKQSGGHITVDSAPGMGASFRIYLPRIDEAITEAPPIKPSVFSTDHTILLVDDEENVRKATVSTLQLKGFRVLEARDGKEAIGIFQNFEGVIELLITDIVMPQMSGRELASQILLERPEVKVLFMSGYSGETVIREDLLRPGTAFVQKPATMDVLLRKIQGLFT
jgi:two-component system, cell cycle sensor histidine kinase and response regulator CckA